MASIVFCGALPLLALALLFIDAIRTDSVAFDFRVFYAAAEAALRGDTLYPSVDDPALVAGRVYVYPPLTAIGVVPLTVLSPGAAGVLVMALFVAAALAVPLVLGVRDWRCIGLVLLWPPVLSAVQTASVTILLALAAALVWRFRERPLRAGLMLGGALAIKLVLWPVAVWLAVTRRVAATAWTAAFGAAFLLGPWAVVGFDGLGEYPGLLRRLSAVMDERSYTVFALARDFGAPSPVARGLWIAIALALLVGVVVYARRGDDKRAFVLAIAASLALTPIVWLHYFALLLVPVAVAQPRLGPVWFVPLLMFLSVGEGNGNGTTLQTAATIATAALTFALALREPRESRRHRCAGVTLARFRPGVP